VLLHKDIGKIKTVNPIDIVIHHNVVAVRVKFTNILVLGSKTKTSLKGRFVFSKVHKLF